ADHSDLKANADGGILLRRSDPVSIPCNDAKEGLHCFGCWTGGALGWIKRFANFAKEQSVATNSGTISP
ncbi:MAG: hypothetical protein WA774_18590, partial [Candidatus Acidiferrales bacterium]